MGKSENIFSTVDLNVDEFTTLFKNAPLYEKFAIVTARKARLGEIITTIVPSKNGLMKETINQANEGDFIVTNPGGEKYIVKGNKFSKLYKKLEDGTFKSLGEVKAIQTNKNLQFIAPWGENMKILAGGYLVENDGDRYGIDESAFNSTYKRKDEHHS